MVASPATRYLRRPEVLNGLLGLFEQPRYLEIGVDAGVTFFEVAASHKVAVDVQFQFDAEKRRGLSNAEFYEVDSDTYFGELARPTDRFDVIYLDGLHTVEQTLRDFCNALEYLADRGVVVIDDVVPNSYHASLPDRAAARRLRETFHPNEADDSWMGDVYRLVFFIQTFFQQYRYATVGDNHGQLVVWKERRPSQQMTPRSLEAVGRAPFEQIFAERETFNVLPFADLIDLLKARPV